MFHMMNEARLGVGLSATVLGYTGISGSLCNTPASGRRDALSPPGTRRARRSRSSNT